MPIRRKYTLHVKINKAKQLSYVDNNFTRHSYTGGMYGIICNKVICNRPIHIYETQGRQISSLDYRTCASTKHKGVVYMCTRYACQILFP